MLPSQTQRTAMLIAVVLAVLVRGVLEGWGTVGPGAALFMGWLGDGVWLLVLLGFGTVLAGSGNVLSGLLVVAGLAAWAWGTADSQSLETLARQRLDTGRDDSLWIGLIVQAVLGGALVVAVAAVPQVAGPRVRPRLPRRLQTRCLGRDASLIGMDGRGAGAALVTALVGGLATGVLVRVADPVQAVGGTAVAFVIAAVIGQAVFPGTRLLGVLLSPALVAVASYGWAMGRWPDDTALLMSAYRGELPGVVLVLPAQYLTAGVAGCAVGLGIGQVVEKAKLGLG